MLLHGEQFVEIHAPLPVNGKFVVKPALVDIQDKGKAALVITRASIVDPDSNKLYATNEVTAFVRGSGGFGRTEPVPRNPAATAANKPPQRAPDAVVTEQTSPDQAALYRLNADYNPLHLDPDFSSKGGFKDPILHGLCSFGISAKHVLQQYGKGKPQSVKNIKVKILVFARYKVEHTALHASGNWHHRFCSTTGRKCAWIPLCLLQAQFAMYVFPGETLQTEMWREGQKVIFQTRVLERDVLAITKAAVELDYAASARL